MDEQQQWTPADDDAVRGALGLLRRDVESLPLADVRFVKARGVARRRRTLVVGAASAAAAVTAVSFIGYNSLESNQGLDNRPSGSTSVTNTSGPTTPVAAAPGPLPVSTEWQRALDITETVLITDLRSGEGVFADCPVSAPGTQFATGSVHAESTGLDASQAVYRATSPDAGNAAAAAAVSQLVGCQSPGMKLTVEADAAWPKVFSTVTVTADDQRSHGWYVMAHHGALTSLIGVFESGTATPNHPLAQIQALALVAQQRLVQEVEGTSPTSTAAADAAVGASGDMPVEGTRPLLSSDLFVAASQWSSPGLSAGHGANAVTTDFEGSAQVFTCDADQSMDMTPDAGRFGLVAVADESTGSILGKQRIRLTASPAAAKAEVQRLVAGVKACPLTNTEVSVTGSPKHPGYFKIVSGLGSDQQLVEWVAVTENTGTSEAVSTLVLRGTPQVTDGFSELDRLVALAVQK